MNRLTAALAATTMLGMAAPVAAQSMQGMDHSAMPGMTMPMPAKKKPAARPAAKGKPAKARPAPARRPAAPTTKRRAAPTASMKGMDHRTMPGMDHSTMPGMDHAAPQGSQQGMEAMPGMQMPGSGQTAPQGSEQPMQGMDHSAMPGMTMPADQHSGHDMQGMSGMAGMPGMAAEGVQQTGTALPAGNAPAPPLPTDHAADAVYGADAMAMGRHHLQQHHGGQNFSQVLLNLAEYQFRNGRDGYRWDGEAWFGGDINRLFIKSEGEGAFRKGIESAEVQALYSRTIGPYFNLQAGVRQDLGPSPKRTYATVGLQGLAPGFFELEGAVFLSNKGDVLGRLGGYYDQRITQRLILQPRAELNFAAQDVPENRIGSGLSNAELGLRLRYEIRREFAPYVGVSWDRRFGDTARYARADGDRATSKSIVAGIRVWF
ncbi:copper resistance protein B [Sphingomonas sp. TX0522]|jgi:copper resistance protein B|uniref:copper resistance protein B n=1 Tax=Sphingomonas sp. TX0522 TaxID=2479205 RepID=UPI0018DF4AED|nr:copper resistance protein B [Sphingomonas sp. TX0522]MBI0533697.1 copper resistance protein B [Sphingomonas sp. TX0522]